MDYEITPEDVKAAADRQEPFALIDVREPWEFQTARIDPYGNVLIDLGGK